MSESPMTIIAIEGASITVCGDSKGATQMSCNRDGLYITIAGLTYQQCDQLAAAFEREAKRQRREIGENGRMRDFWEAVAADEKAA